MIWTLPIISALIGWVTNYIAIKMLFHPRKEISILGIKIQGIFPKRQKALAEKIGKLVGEQLFSIADLKKEMQNETHLEGVKKLLDEKVESFLKSKITTLLPFVAMFINDELIGKIKNMIVEELTKSLPDIIAAFTDKLEKDIDIKSIVESKVAAFSIDKLEDMLFSIMQKEFKFIELVGAFLGFLIGCIQVGLMYFTV